MSTPIVHWAYPSGYCRLARVKETTRDPYNTAVAAALDRIYVSKGSPLAQVAEAVGISRMTVRRYLNGERDIRVVELRGFADALGVTVAEILREADRGVKQIAERDIQTVG